MTTARQDPQLTVLVDPAGHPVLDPGRLASGFAGLPRVRWLAALPTAGGEVAGATALAGPAGELLAGGPLEGDGELIGCPGTRLGRLLVAAPS